jgi:hypothetical protein
MITVSQLQKEELRDSLLKLALACPVENCNPQDCPLFAVRRMDPGKRLEWFNALSLDRLSYLAAYHHLCMGRKFHLQMIRPEP